MKKHGYMRILLISGSILILIGVALLAWWMMTDSERTVIKVELETDVTQTLSFERLSLVPGEEVFYTIKLNNKKADAYSLYLDFSQVEDKGLKEYARVRIKTEEQTVYDELLSTAFEDESLVLPIDFVEKKNTELTIVYYLPIDIGNEAENTAVKFDLAVTASNK